MLGEEVLTLHEFFVFLLGPAARGLSYHLCLCHFLILSVRIGLVLLRGDVMRTLRIVVHRGFSERTSWCGRVGLQLFELEIVFFARKAFAYPALSCITGHVVLSLSLTKSFPEGSFA